MMSDLGNVISTYNGEDQQVLFFSLAAVVFVFTCHNSYWERGGWNLEGGGGREAEAIFF